MATKVKDLPGPKGKPVIGNLFSLDLPQLHNSIEEWSAEHGDVFRLNLGIFDQLVVTRPSMLQKIMKERPHGFARSEKLNKVIRESGVHGVFNTEGIDWKKHRPIVAKGLDVKHQKDFYPAIEPILGRLYKKWQERAKSGEAFFIQKDLLRFTVDVTSSLAFGYSMNTIEEEGGAIQDHLEKVFPMIFKRINMPVPWYKLYRTKEDKEFDVAVLEMNRLVDEFITAARKRLQDNPELRENPPSVIEAIIVAAEEQEDISDEDVRGNILTLLMAGEDTTAVTLNWLIYLLSQEPEVTEKMRDEANSVLGDKKWATVYEDNAKMRYIEGAAFESMRFKPVAPIMLFQANEDIQLEEVSIKKGQRILTQHRYGSLQEENFSEASQFKPERWLKESRCPVHNTEAFSPFGGGARYCPGRNLAILEIRMVMSMLLKNFEVELVTPYDSVDEKMAFTMMSSPYEVRLKER
ncbi:MAG: cytochrome P450 [bacterium]|nr:cytochrome P450 [bacterium]